MNNIYCFPSETQRAFQESCNRTFEASCNAEGRSPAILKNLNPLERSTVKYETFKLNLANIHYPEFMSNVETGGEFTFEIFSPDSNLPLYFELISSRRISLEVIPTERYIIIFKESSKNTDLKCSVDIVKNTYKSGTREPSHYSNESLSLNDLPFYRAEYTKPSLETDITHFSCRMTAVTQGLFSNLELRDMRALSNLKLIGLECRLGAPSQQQSRDLLMQTLHGNFSS